LPGKQAQLQVMDRQPTFYFVMPTGQVPEGFSIVEMARGFSGRAGLNGLKGY
jgi:hypothetical protein